MTEKHGFQLLHSHVRRSLELAHQSATDLVCVIYLSVLFLFYFSIKPEVSRLSSTIAERVSSRFPKPSLEVLADDAPVLSSIFDLNFSDPSDLQILKKIYETASRGHNTVYRGYVQ